MREMKSKAFGIAVAFSTLVETPAVQAIYIYAVRPSGLQLAVEAREGHGAAPRTAGDTVAGGLFL